MADQAAVDRALGNAAIKAGRYADADDIYTTCLQQQPEEAERLLLLSNRSTPTTSSNHSPLFWYSTGLFNWSSL